MQPLMMDMEGPVREAGDDLVDQKDLPAACAGRNVVELNVPKLEGEIGLRLAEEPGQFLTAADELAEPRTDPDDILVNVMECRLDVVPVVFGDDPDREILEACVVHDGRFLSGRNRRAPDRRSVGRAPEYGFFCAVRAASV